MTTVVQPLIEPDCPAIKSHLEVLFAPCAEHYPRGLLEIRYGREGALNQFSYFNTREDGITEAAAFAANRNREGCNVYVGVNPRKATTDTRRAGNTGDVEIAFWHFADIDKADAVANAGRKLRALPPTMTVNTGTIPHRRPHIYWQLEEPVSNMEAWTQRQLGIAQALGGDHVIDPPRIMRLAGTVNFPTQKKLQAGYQTETTSLKATFDEERAPVTPDEVAQAFPVQLIASAPMQSQGQNTLRAMAAERNGVRPADYIARIQSGDNWHNNARDLVAHWVSIGWTDAEILLAAPALTLPGYGVGDTERSLTQYLQSARTKFNVPEPDRDVAAEERAREEARTLNVVDAFDFNEADIPVRPWLVPGALLAGYTHMLAAPGGSGKSLFTLQFAIALATGMQWSSFTPRKRYRSLIVNVEDDLNEQRRRLSAAARVMGVDPQQLRGWIYIVDAADGIVVAGHDANKRTLVMKPVATKLREYIEENKIDVMWADPFAETFEGDENDNSEVKWAMKIWRDEIARPTKTAIYLVHHTTKYAANGAGDANVIRGAGAIVNSTRISATLMPMTAEEATAIGVDQDERHLFVRYDDAKANQSLKTNTARWFRKESVELSNGAGLEEPDEVGALVPWTPPDAFDGLSLASINMVLDRVEEGIIDADGVVTGVRYTASTKGGSKDSGRWIGCLFMDVLGMKEAQAKKVIGTWLATGVLVEQEHYCPEQRRKRTGLFAPHDKRPGEVF